MSSKVDFFLKKTLGEDFFESLQKVELWKPGTRSTVDHEELRTALQIVPRTVIALLIRELTPMKIGDTKEFPLFVSATAKVRATKHERDVYSGEIEEENKKVVDFKFRALPGVGLVIMSAFELYDMENLINSDNYQVPTPTPPPQPADDVEHKVQRLIDERLAIHELVSKVVEKKISERDAIHRMMMNKLTAELEAGRKIKELREIQERTTPQSEEYFRGMTNGLEVANASVNGTEPHFIEPIQKKERPLKKFLEDRKKKPKEFSFQMAKGETVSCPDCGNNIFDGRVFSGCICFGDSGKVFLKKTEDGFKIRFSKNWDIENIEMLLEILRKKNK